MFTEHNIAELELKTSWKNTASGVTCEKHLIKIECLTQMKTLSVLFVEECYSHRKCNFLPWSAPMAKR